MSLIRHSSIWGTVEIESPDMEYRYGPELVDPPDAERLAVLRGHLESARAMVDYWRGRALSGGQSRAGSAVEAWSNVILGGVINAGLVAFVLPALYLAVGVGWTAAITTGTMAGASFVRSYFIRRWFEWWRGRC